MATPWDLNSPMYMILNLAVGGNWAGSPNGSTSWPGEMKIDYAMKNNFGFGGTNGTLVFKRV